MKEPRFFIKMADEELIEYMRQNYIGKSITEIERGCKAAYRVIKSRELTDRLIGEGIIVPKERKKRYYYSKTDFDLIRCVEEKFYHKKISDIQKKDHPLYREIIKRNLFPLLIDRKILIKTQRDKRFYKNKSDQELKRKILHDFFGEEVIKIARNDRLLYDEIRNRGLIEDLIKRGIITRSKKTNGIWKSLEYALQQAREFKEKFNFDELPPTNKLEEYGQSSLLRAIYKYHGGMKRFKELLGENTIKKIFSQKEIDNAFNECKSELGRNHSCNEFQKKHRWEMYFIRKGRYHPKIRTWSQYLEYRGIKSDITISFLETILKEDKLT